MALGTTAKSDPHGQLYRSFHAWPLKDSEVYRIFAIGVALVLYTVSRFLIVSFILEPGQINTWMDVYSIETEFRLRGWTYAPLAKTPPLSTTPHFGGKWLSFPLGIVGVTNQRLRLKGGLIVAIRSSRSLYLPPMAYSRALFVADWTSLSEAGWTKIPLHSLFDADYLRVCAQQRLGIFVAEVCEPRQCPLPASATVLTYSDVFRNNATHVTMRAPPFIDLQREPVEIPISEAADACIRFSPAIRAAAEDVLRIVSRAPAQLIGIHARIEEDGASFFGKGRWGWDAYANATIDRIMECFDLHLPARDSGSYVVYVASGLSVDSPLLRRLSQRFNLVTKDSAASAPSLRAVTALGGDALAAVDHLVLRHARFFIGFDESTFSIQVAAERLRLALPSALHSSVVGRGSSNASSAPPICLAFTGFTKW